MAQFRKKPVAIEAWQWPRSHRVAIEAWQWPWSHRVEDRYEDSPFLSAPVWLRESLCADPDEEGSIFLSENMDWCVKTLEGEHLISRGDWIIQGVQGELCPCKPDIFEATYDPVVAGAG